ncbi:PAS domain S-box protein [Lysobacter korlensis]|uniref:histidine kinase n=1 Tax=Lysobacter korlensis TaxID=553636 RepID=A0ABV6RKF0_9GAMM
MSSTRTRQPSPADATAGQSPARPDLLEALDALDAFEQSLGTTGDAHEVLDAAAALTVSLLAADAVVIDARDTCALPSVPAPVIAGARAADVDALRGAVLANAADADALDVRFRTAGFPTANSVPLRRDGSADGTLTVLFRRPRSLDAQDGRVLTLCARIVARFLDRLATQERLRESEDRYFSLIDETNAAVLQATPDGRICHANRYACGMFGYDEAELLGMHLFDITAEDSLDSTRDALKRLGGDGQAVVYEKRYRRKDGSQLWASCSASALVDAGGQVQRLLSVIVDLGERQRSEALQRGLREVLERVAGGEPTPEVLGELVHVLERASKRGLVGAMTLFDAKSVRLRTIAAPSMPAAYHEAIASAVNGTGLHPDTPATTALLERICDSLCPIASEHGLHACKAIPIVSSRGRTLGLFVAHYRDDRELDRADCELLDIATRTAALAVERALVEQALRESENRFRTMADHAPMMIWVTESDGSCSYLSQSWFEFTGISALTRLRDSWLACIHDDDRARVLTVYRMAQARRRPVRVEYRLRRHDGQYRWVLDAAAPRIDEDGSLLGFIGSVLEIDEHRRRERDARFAAQLQSALAQLDDADEIMHVAADRICRYFNIPTLVFADVEEDRNQATVVHLHGDARVTATPRTLADVIDDSFIAPLQSGHAITVHDVATDPRTTPRLDEYRKRDIGAVLIVPFPSGGRWRFVMVAQDTTARIWRDDERELLHELTARVHLRLERARANLAMRQSREQYRMLFESIDEGFCVVEMLFDADGCANDYRFLELNPAFERHSGLRNALGRTMRELVPQHEDHWFRTFGEVAQSGRPVRLEAQARAMQRWLDVYAFRIGNATDGRIAVLFSDITGRKQTEEALRRNEERLRLALVTGRLGSWQLDLLTMDFTCTALCKAHYGLSSDAALNYARLWGELVHPDDRDMMQNELRAAIEHHRDYEAEYRVVWPDGSVHWLVARGRAGYDTTGRAVAVAGVTLDITERRQTEDALRDADRRKDEFIATLAHELRNPLAPLRHCLHILQMDSAGATDTPRLHAMMDRQVRHLVRLVDDLLEVSRISRGKIELRPESVDLAQVIHHAVETSRPLIDAGRHALELELAPQRLMLDADPIRLAQVFSNLLNNAAKYTPHGGRIVVSAAAEDGVAVVRVRDTGVGIPVEMLPRVFDMFSQVDHSLGQAQGGLGIGLTLVRSLVELHGGTVCAASAGKGMGSEFTVRLPLSVLPQPVQPDTSLRTAGPAAGAQRLLVVDDNRESADSLAMFLRLCGKDVHVAYDGEAGIDAAARLRPDAMLVDIGMPGRNGHDVCAHIRAQPWGDSLAIFAVTGWGQKDDRERSERTGFDAHLVKPVDPDALLALVDEACRARRERTPL